MDDTFLLASQALALSELGGRFHMARRAIFPPTWPTRKSFVLRLAAKAIPFSAQDRCLCLYCIGVHRASANNTSSIRALLNSMSDPDYSLFTGAYAPWSSCRESRRLNKPGPPALLFSTTFDPAAQARSPNVVQINANTII